MRPRDRRIPDGQDDAAALGASSHDARGNHADAGEGGFDAVARRQRELPGKRAAHDVVAAGHDRFPAAVVEEHLGKIRDALHLSYEDFMGLGRVYPADANELFCMTVLALKLSRYANGVSAFDGQVAQLQATAASAQLDGHIAQLAAGSALDQFAAEHVRLLSADLDRLRATTSSGPSRGNTT